MSSHEAATRPDAVLHIRSTPLTKTQRDGLLALGVSVSHLAPLDVQSALEDDDDRTDMIQRIRDAEVCVLDDGTGLRIAMAVLSYRRTGQGATYTTSIPVFDAVSGLTLAQDHMDEPPLRCEPVAKADLLRLLRGLSQSPLLPATPTGPDGGAQPRPARPLPFIADPSVYSVKELGVVDPECVHLQVSDGRLPPRTLLEPGTAAAHATVPALTILRLIVLHLPTEELGLLRSDEAAAWWARVAREAPNAVNGQNEQYQIVLQALLWDAVARDGGRDTLAMLPAVHHPLRDAVVRGWASAVAEVGERLPLELASPTACQRPGTVGMWALRKWGAVPCGDPLAVDADPNLFRPTITTFHVARRYRSAPEVILGAFERWGARPYLENLAAGQLVEFISESRPTSMADLEGWIRLLATLPDGRLRQHVVRGVTCWPRIEMPLAVLIQGNDIIGSWEEVVGETLPCLSDSWKIPVGALNAVQPGGLNHRVRGHILGTSKDYLARARRKIDRLRGGDSPTMGRGRAR